MGLGALDSALSGLRVAQQQLDVISGNISNVNTDGYTRKILPQSAQSVQGVTYGVSGENIVRNVDLNLSRDFWNQISATSYYEVQSRYLNQIQQFHGAPDENMSVAAEISDLKDSFAALADAPEDTFLLKSVVTQAQTVAGKINDFADLLTQMRNDAQDEITQTVDGINSLLQQIATLNKQIKVNKSAGKTTAALEDLRDKAVKDLSGKMEISLFTRGDGVMVIQTARGEQLADENAESLYFKSTPLGPQSDYPSSAAALYLRNPSDPSSVDLTTTDLGGTLGGLFELRDQSLPTYTAQLDELAHKLAYRFQQEGLMLFTDASGQVPADTDPNPGTNTPVPYVGFASEIQVNRLIVNDNTLVRSGTVTTDSPVQTGSNQVIQRVLDSVFGETAYQEASGTVDLRAAGVGGVDLQTWLGIYSQNTVKGGVDMSQYANITALFNAGGDTFNPTLPLPQTDQFTISFSEPRLGLGPTTVTIDLSAADANFPVPPAVNAADQIAQEINNQITLAGVPAGLAAQASVSSLGELIISSRGNVTIDASGANGMGQDGLDFLGLKEGTTTTTDPWFEVQVGNDPKVRISIEPGDDENDLFDKLDLNPAIVGDTGVEGLAVDQNGLLAATGHLKIRPGDDSSAYTNFTFGGSMKVFGGAFQSDGTGGSGVAAGSSIVQALFGSQDPVSDFSHAAFKQSNLGPGVDLDTGIAGSTQLIDFAQKMVNNQTQAVSTAEAKQSDESSYQDLLSKKLLDQSGVNLDEEMANLIVMQTAYAAAARAVQAIDGLFQDLLNSI